MCQKKNILPENTIEIFEFSRQKNFFFFLQIFLLCKTKWNMRLFFSEFHTLWKKCCFEFMHGNFPSRKKVSCFNAKDRGATFLGGLTGNCILTQPSKKPSAWAKKVQITEVLVKMTKEWREEVQVKIVVSHALSGWNGRKLRGWHTHGLKKNLRREAKH